MNNKELDKWIAENVMCLDVSKYPIEHESVDINSRSVYVWVEKIPKYTTDPAAAMEVLKKCAAMVGMLGISINSGDWGFDIEVNTIGGQNSYGVTNKSLELAICLFAKKLFSKSERD